MCKRGLCCRPVSVCLYTNKKITKVAVLVNSAKEVMFSLCLFCKITQKLLSQNLPEMWMGGLSGIMGVKLPPSRLFLGIRPIPICTSWHERKH